MMNLLKKQKGITLISLVMTIIILLIISMTIALSSSTSMELSNGTKLKSDMQAISDRVSIYYVKNNRLPITGTTYNKSAVVGSVGNLSPDDGNIYYVIDLSELPNLTLNYSSNIYIINEETHNIYYLKDIIHNNVNNNNIESNEVNPNIIENDEYHRVYAIIYNNGEMVFNSTGNTDLSKTVEYKSNDIGNLNIDSSDNLPWKDYETSVTTVTFEENIKPIYTAYWFYGFNNLTTINNISNLNTEDVTSMKCMFLRM